MERPEVHQPFTEVADGGPLQRGQAEADRELNGGFGRLEGAS